MTKETKKMMGAVLIIAILGITMLMLYTRFGLEQIFSDLFMTIEWLR